VAALRDGPSAAQIHSSGQLTAPPFGKGSLGLTVDTGEQASFGDQVDFYGDNVLDLTAVGFYEFNTGENGTSNNASIKLEINPNVTGPTDGYTTMVWVPADNPYVDQWSPYLDATQSGTWYFTGSEGATITCSQGSPKRLGRPSSRHTEVAGGPRDRFCAAWLSRFASLDDERGRDGTRWTRASARAGVVGDRGRARRAAGRGCGAHAR
jgi:hypothetical protein